MQPNTEIEQQRKYIQDLRMAYDNSSFRMGPEYRRLIREAEGVLRALEQE